MEEMLKEVEGGKGENSVGKRAGPEVLWGLAKKIGLTLELSSAELMGGSRRRRVVEGRRLVSYMAIRGYGMSLTQVGKGMNISIQSVLRGVERGQEEFQRRGWGLAEFL